MANEMRSQGERRDRWVNVIVFAGVLAALLLGWKVKAAAENRTVACDVEGLSLRYPAGWVRANVNPPVLLQVEDRMARDFPTQLVVQRRPLPGALAKPLAAAQQSLALERATQWNAYRELQMEEGVSVAGRQGTHVTFAFVETSPDPFLETLPVVARGEDYIFAQEGEAYVFTLLASEAAYGQAHQALLALVGSW
jgi:hypothetical protein